MQVYNDKNRANYDRVWYVPVPVQYRPSPNDISKAAAVDNNKGTNSAGLGDRMTATAQNIANGWNSQSESVRYGSNQDAVRTALGSVNSYLLADGQIELTLDQIDQLRARPPVLQHADAASNSVYKTAVRNFWFQRAVAIGKYVHVQVAAVFQNEVGLTDNGNNAGPDFSYRLNNGPVVYYEILPTSQKSLAAHAERSMNTNLWRAVFYDRNAINNPDLVGEALDN
jgi:hypothetical protein